MPKLTVELTQEEWLLVLRHLSSEALSDADCLDGLLLANKIATELNAWDLLPRNMKIQNIDFGR